MKRKIKIVIAEDQTLVREGLRSLLSLEKEFNVIGDAEDGLQTVRLADRLHPHVILLDLAMPKMSGISAIHEIKRKHPKIKVIALTSYTSDDYILAAFQAGADGYCLKSDSRAELFTAIRRVLENKVYLSSEISGKVLESWIEKKQGVDKPVIWKELTRREIEILKLVGEGYSSPNIGAILGISPKTADKHRANIMKKLDLHSASALTAYAIENGLIDKSR